MGQDITKKRSFTMNAKNSQQAESKGTVREEEKHLRDGKASKGQPVTVERGKPTTDEEDEYRENDDSSDSKKGSTTNSRAGSSSGVGQGGSIKKSQ